MLQKTIADYGGPFVNERLVTDPTSQQDASFGNRELEDVAQLTRTGILAWVSFVPTSDAAPKTLDATNVTAWTVWGSSSAYKPTVEKTADGEYTITFAATYDDALVGVPGLETVAETQSVVFTFASQPNCRGPFNGYGRVVEIVSNVVRVVLYDTSDTNSDLASDSLVEFSLR